MTLNLRRVAEILSSIDSPPSIRSQPKPGDLQGAFDKWFDGGAMKIVTGWNEYHYADGVLAVVPTASSLCVEMRLPTGQYVTITEHAKAPPNIAFIAV